MLINQVRVCWEESGCREYPQRNPGSQRTEDELKGEWQTAPLLCEVGVRRRREWTQGGHDSTERASSSTTSPKEGRSGKGEEFHLWKHSSNEKQGWCTDNSYHGSSKNEWSRTLRDNMTFSRQNVERTKLEYVQSNSIYRKCRDSITTWLYQKWRHQLPRGQKT